MLGVDFASFDCQPERDAAHVEMIRSLGKGEPALGAPTVGESGSGRSPSRIPSTCTSTSPSAVRVAGT